MSRALTRRLATPDREDNSGLSDVVLREEEKDCSLRSPFWEEKGDARERERMCLDVLSASPVERANGSAGGVCVCARGGRERKKKKKTFFSLVSSPKKHVTLGSFFLATAESLEYGSLSGSSSKFDQQRPESKLSDVADAPSASVFLFFFLFFLPSLSAGWEGS